MVAVGLWMIYKRRQQEEIRLGWKWFGYCLLGTIHFLLKVRVRRFAMPLKDTKNLK
jgi:hypothetical protein